MKTVNELRSIFSQIDDPRSDINKLHKLEDILLIGIISVICAADTWKNMETYAKAKEEFLRSFLDLPNGIPSDDTFNRVFSSIDSEQFETCFVDWVSCLVNLIDANILIMNYLYNNYLSFYFSKVELIKILVYNVSIYPKEIIRFNYQSF